MLIEFEKRSDRKRIPNFSKELLREEGSGILRWMVEGAQLLLRDIAEAGTICLVPKQEQRINDLLNESDSVSMFVTERVICVAGRSCSTKALYNDYLDFCADEAFSPVTEKQFERQVRPEMMDTYGVRPSENIKSEDKQRNRGYRGISLKSKLIPSSKPSYTWD